MPRRMDPPTPQGTRPASLLAPQVTNPTTKKPGTARTYRFGKEPQALAPLAVLGALAPVSRASFLALRAATDLPAPALLGALLRLRDADLVTVEFRRTGSSRIAFAISAEGRAVLQADEPSLAQVVPPPAQRRPSALVPALRPRALASPARPDTQEGRTRFEADGQETPEAAPHESQEAPPAKDAKGNSPGPPHGPAARGCDDGLGEATEPAVLAWARGVRSRNEACRDAHRTEGRVPGRLAALFDDAPPFPSRPDAATGETR